MSHYVYIIQSLTSGRWYFGYSTDIDRRLAGHNAGLNTSTRNRGPWKLIFARVFDNKKDALIFERLLKKTRNKAYIIEEYSEYFVSS